MLVWLKFLLAFLSLFAEGDEGGGGDEGSEAAGGNDEEDTTLDELLDERERKLGGKPGERGAEETPADKRAREAEERAQAAERRAENAERIAREAPIRAPAAPQVDAEYEREEAQLRSARESNEDTTWLAWKIDIDRKNRASQKSIQEERLRAEEARDQAAFERLELSHPKLYNKYRDKVNQARMTAMQSGQLVPRLALLDLMLGNELRTRPAVGKKKPAGEEAAPVRRVERPSSPGARSDVTGKGGKSEREKRRERLRNLQI